MGDERIELRRLSNPRRTFAFLISTALVAVAAFTLGTFVQSPDAEVLDARWRSVPVYASVEARVVSNDVRIQGQVVGPTPRSIFIGPPNGASLPVVTSVAVEARSELENGALLGTVSDRPVFVFALQVPLYRSLHRGDRGSDVYSVQAALGVEPSGTVDEPTLNAVRALYASAGLEPPGGTGWNTHIRIEEFYCVPAEGKMHVASIAPVGSVLGSDQPFAVITSGSSHVVVRASVTEADRIDLGDKVALQSSASFRVEGTVAGISAFRSSGTDSGRPPGRDVVIDIPVESDLEPGSPVSAMFGGESEPGLSVPTLGVRSDSLGHYVLVADDMGEVRRVDIALLRHANGWTAVESAQLDVGDQLLVSP